MADLKSKDTANARNEASRRMLPLIKLVRDVYGGTQSMRESGQEYLPKHPAETEDDYRSRLTGATLFNAFARTVGGLSGLIFRKDLVINAPDEIIEHLEDVDKTGRSIDTFGKDTAEDASIDGLSLILVDFPMVGENEIQTLADERKANLRPTWVAIAAQDFISARFSVELGKPKLSQFVYREWVTEPLGVFIEERVEQFRVLRIGNGEDGGGEVGVFELWRWDTSDKSKKLVLYKQGTWDMPGGANEIPVAVLYSGRLAHFEGRPPLWDLANENIAHWRLRADHLHALHVANVPIPIFIGRDRDDEEDDEITFGISYGIDLPEGGDAKYLEWSGASIASSREELKDIEQRMAVLGLSMLMRETRAAETAESKSMDKAAEDSALAAFASSLETALNEALRFHLLWLNQEIGDAKITVNRDYMITALDAPTIQQLANLVGAGALSIETLWEMLVEGEILPETFDPEQEVERIQNTVNLLQPVAPPETPGKSKSGADDDVSDADDDSDDEDDDE